jgi:hypothetical protein
MLTKRSETWRGLGLLEVANALQVRLQRERFVLSPVRNPLELTAARKKTFAHFDPRGAAMAMDDKPLAAAVKISESGEGVSVDGSMWTTDLVFLDTGEGRHIDQVLGKLVCQNPPPDAPPIRELSYAVKVALYVTGLICVSPLLIVLLPASQAAGVLSGAMLGLLLSVGLSAAGLYGITRRPLLSIGGFIAGFAMFKSEHPEALRDKSTLKFISEIQPTLRNLTR